MSDPDEVRVPNSPAALVFQERLEELSSAELDAFIADLDGLLLDPVDTGAFADWTPEHLHTLQGHLVRLRRRLG